MSKTQVAGLRALADLIEKDERIGKLLGYPLNHLGTFPSIREEDGWDEKGMFAYILRTFKDAGFKITKDYSSSYFTLTAKMPSEELHEGYVYEGFALEFSTNREAVCTPKVVGQTTTTRKVMPDRDTWDEKTVTEDVIEWDCSPILGNDE